MELIRSQTIGVAAEGESEAQMFGYDDQGRRTNPVPQGQLIVMYFHLPIKIVRSDVGLLEVREVETSVVPGLWKKWNSSNVIFIGWPGIIPRDQREQKMIEELCRKHRCRAVLPSEEDIGHFMQCCHSFLFPVLHELLLFFEKVNPQVFNR